MLRTFPAVLGMLSSRGDKHGVSYSQKQPVSSPVGVFLPPANAWTAVVVYSFGRGPLRTFKDSLVLFASSAPALCSINSSLIICGLKGRVKPRCTWCAEVCPRVQHACSHASSRPPGPQAAGRDGLRAGRQWAARCLCTEALEFCCVV